MVLNRSTIRRLQSLQQIPSVWEGDRRPITPDLDPEMAGEVEGRGDCIIWVDGFQGMVRAMDVVPPDTGPEAIVRTLIRAMEHPQGPAPTGRPQKIVVKNREIQFFLRGVLQELGINIDYVPELPIIDEIFMGMQAVAQNRPPQLPPQYVEGLLSNAYDIWVSAPWRSLAEYEIVQIELNLWDIESVYVSVLGNRELDYGILLYRSLESLKRFRQMVISSDESFPNLEQAFLGQDCLFVTFESHREDDEDDDVNLGDLPPSDVMPNFGNLHPLEGLRSILYEEEAAVVLVALDAFNRFLQNNRRKLGKDKFPSITGTYKIDHPHPSEGEEKTISVKVSTLPDVARELLEMIDRAVREDDSADFDDFPILRDDLIPPNSLLSLGVLPWDSIDFLRNGAKFYQEGIGDLIQNGDGLPVIMIQTSKPKAKSLIDAINNAGGLKAICFNPGEDILDEEKYDLGILQTQDGKLYLFGEFAQDDPVHKEAKKKWERRCKATKGWCALIVAMGLTGASRGQPKYKDMIALFEVRSASPKDLGLGPLQRISLPTD